MEGQQPANSVHTQIIAPSTLSWHGALPRLMLYEVIHLNRDALKAAGTETDFCWLLYGLLQYGGVHE